MSGNGARVLGRDGLRGERDSAEATLKAMRSDKFEWLAKCRFGGEGCELPASEPAEVAGERGDEGRSKSSNIFKGLLLGVDMRKDAPDDVLS
ncbi:hypothetical protein BE221DRAFT_91260, partial [Ostreococcus tauri]